MPRPEKVAAVAEISERIDGAQAVFLAEYAGLSVKQQQELRRALKAQDAEFKVLKMTLTRRAAAALDITDLDDLLIGPTGLAFADGDPVSAAKVLKEFAAANDVFAIKGGLLGRDFLTPERIGRLADIAPREELLAKLAGAMKAPLVEFVSVLSALPRNAASVAQQLLEKKQAGEFVDAAADGASEEVADGADASDDATAAADAAADDIEVMDEAVEDAADEAVAEAADDQGNDSEDDTATAQADAEGSDDDTADAAEEE